MKCNPWRWLWGLVPVIVMGWAAVQIEHARIERELTAAGRAALAQAGLGWADLSFSGRDGTLSGKATEEGEPARAVEIALGTWGVRNVRDVSGLIDKVDSYEWAALRRDNRIRLDGLVPNEQARRQVIGIVKASVPNLEVDDRMRLARGAPPTDIWLGGVGFGIKLLAQLKGGRVDLDVANLSITGEAADVKAYRSLKTALRGPMPPGISLKQDNVRAPVVKTHVWSAQRTGDQLTLSGFVPNDKALEEILAAARQGTDRLRVVDETQPGDGEARGWLPAAIAVVRALSELEEGAAELRDTALTFTGLAETQAAADAARKAFQGLDGPIKVTEQVRVRPPPIPVISPHVTAGTLENGELALSGHVPSEEAREALLAFVARTPDLKVRDDLQLGIGQKSGWRSCIEAGLDALVRLGNGQVRLVDDKLEISGKTRAQALAQSLPDSVRGAAGSDCQTDVRIAWEPPPEPRLRWSALNNQNGIVLSGEVPGEEARTELVRAAEVLFAGKPIDDRMTPVGERSAKWVRTAREGMGLLALLDSGEARIADLELTIAGEAREAPVRGHIRETLGRALPEGYSGRESVTVRPDPPRTPASQSEPTAAIDTKPDREAAARKAEADTCQDTLQTVMRTGTIEFERSSAQLDPASLPTLERLAEVASKCNKVRIEVNGHTDPEGDPDHNQRLSEKRAQAVVDFLASAGVPAARMHAIGYGFSRPAVPNTSEENRARNRRIEFVVTAE